MKTYYYSSPVEFRLRAQDYAHTPHRKFSPQNVYYIRSWVMRAYGFSSISGVCVCDANVEA